MRLKHTEVGDPLRRTHCCMISSGYWQYLLQGCAMRLQKSFSDLREPWNHLGALLKWRFLASLLGILILWVWGEGSESDISFWSRCWSTIYREVVLEGINSLTPELVFGGRTILEWGREERDKKRGKRWGCRAFTVWEKAEKNLKKKKIKSECLLPSKSGFQYLLIIVCTFGLNLWNIKLHAGLKYKRQTAQRNTLKSGNLRTWVVFLSADNLLVYSRGWLIINKTLI